MRPGMFEGTDENDIPRTTFAVELHCTNDGRSPAWVKEKSARMIIVKHEEIPPIPELTEEDIIDKGYDPVGPGKDAIPFTWDATGTGKHSTRTATIIYGVVRYADIFRENRETWFCYQLVGDAAHRKLTRIYCGPDYSKQT